MTIIHKHSNATCPMEIERNLMNLGGHNKTEGYEEKYGYEYDDYVPEGEDINGRTEDKTINFVGKGA